MTRYAVAVEVSGRVTVEVEADSEDEAGSMAREQVADTMGPFLADQLHVVTDYGDAFDVIGGGGGGTE